MSERRRRVIVAIDASPASVAACRAARAIAASRDADLVGLFVEDVQLLSQIQHGDQREVDLYSARARVLDPAELEAQLRVRAQQARRAFELAVRGAGIECTFRVVRDTVAGALSTAAQDAELVTIGLVGWSLAGRRHVGSTVRALIDTGRGRLLVLQPNRQLDGLIRIALEPDAPIDDLVEAAATLATRDDARIEIVSFAPDVAEGSALAETAKVALAKRGLKSTARWLGPPDDTALARATRPAPGVLVLSTAGALFRPERLPSIDVPLLLVLARRPGVNGSRPSP